MTYKNSLKYIIIIALMIFVIIMFLPIKTEIINNNAKIYHSIIDLGVADYGFASALLVGLLGFFTTIYTNEKNLKAAKASLIPEKSLELYNQLKLSLIFYNKYNDDDNFDDIQTYIDILRISKDYLAVVQLYTPNLYDELMNILLDNVKDNFEYDYIYEKNAQLIINEILIAMIINASGENELLKYKDSKQCIDSDDIESIDDEIEIEISKKSLMNYINNIKGDKTKELTLKKFLIISDSITQVISKVDKEKEKFGLKDF